MTEGQGGPGPGWYPNPEGQGERWWNGVSWGELRPAPAAQQQQQPHQQYGPQQPQQGQHPGQQWGQQPQQGQQSAAPDMRCVHCGWRDFASREFLLNTRGMTFFDMDAFNAAARCLICRRCGFIHWFATQ